MRTDGTAVARRRRKPEIADPDGANARFRREAEAVGLRFRCADCAHYAPAADRCSLGFETFWLTTPEQRMCTDDGFIVFCKYFELD